MELDTDFELIAIKDENIPIYTYAGSYYVVFPSAPELGAGPGYLAFRPTGTADDISYIVNREAVPLPIAGKIDYSKLPTLEGITTMIFGANGTAHPKISSAIDVAAPLPVASQQWYTQPPAIQDGGPGREFMSPTYIPNGGPGREFMSPTYIPPTPIAPAVQAARAVQEARAVEATPAVPMPEQMPIPEQMPASTMHIVVEDEPEPEIQIPEPEDVHEEDMDDFLADLFAVGEITTMETIRGTKVQTLEININSIKTLLEKSENEFMNEVNSRFIINMNKIAQLRRENDTVGKTLLNIKGLPAWVTPIVSGEFVATERAYSQVNTDAFQIHAPQAQAAQTQGCNMVLDRPVAPLYTSYAMDTDKEDAIPGSWRKTRTDTAVEAVYQTLDHEGKKVLSKVKLPSNEYQTSINLTEAAITRMRDQQGKSLRKQQTTRGCANRPSMYVRLLTVPKAIKNIEITLKGTERAANINGFMVREPGATEQSVIVPVNCSSTESSHKVLEAAINKFYPTPKTVIERAQCGDISSYMDVLKQHQYERNDLTVTDWKAIGKGLKLKLTMKRTADDSSYGGSPWGISHAKKIRETMNRVVNPQAKHMRAADNDKYQLCVDLEHYMKSIADTDKTMPTTTPSEATGLTVQTARYNNITNDHVHGLLFRSDVTGKFYTASAYKQQLRHQLWSQLSAKLANAEAEAETGCRSDKMKLILTDLEHWQTQTNKGILDNLKLKLSGSGTAEASSTLNLLTSFDTSDIIGQVNFIRHMDTFIDSGFVRLNPFTKQYVLVQTKEVVCCQHVLEDMKEHSMAEFIGSNGRCKYCLAAIEAEGQADDFAQTQFTTTRDMYAGGEDAPDTDPEHATLKYFLGHCIKWLSDKLQEAGVVLSSANVEQIINDSMEYIKETNPAMTQPYGPVFNSKPIGWTPDMRLAVLFDQQIVERAEGEDTERSIMRKRAETGKPTGTKSFFRVLSYFRENESDSTTDTPQVLAPRLRGKLMDLMMNQTKCFPLLFNLLVMNRLSYCTGVLLAHLNLTVNLEYSNMEKLSYLTNELFNICNTFQPFMSVILETHIKNLRTGDKESQTQVMPHFDAYKRLFNEEFNRDLYAIGFTSRIPAEERAVDAFNKTYEVLQRQNAGLYEIIERGAEGTGFAKYEATRGMVQYQTLQTRSISAGPVKNMKSYLVCYTNNLIKGKRYGENLWEQYENTNKALSNVVLPGGTLSNDVNDATFQASVCSSKVLLEGPMIHGAIEDDTIQNYLENERVLKAVGNAHSADLSLIDEELCEFNLAVPRYNNSLQSNQVYYPCCNPTNDHKLTNGQVLSDAGVGGNTSKNMLHNMRVLLTYKNLAGYGDALDGEIFKRVPGVGAARINYLTNDIAAINPGSVATVVNNEWHKLVHDRRYTLGLKGSLPEPENVDEVPGFDDDFPKLVKTQAQVRSTDDDTINRRRIFRIQNNGRTLKNLILWMTKDLSPEAIQELKNTTEQSEKSNMTSSSRYSIEKELASTEGYVLSDLIDVKWQFRSQIESMHLETYRSAIPEIYTMSFLEFKQIMGLLEMPDEQNLASFRETIYAAIRLDIILHVKNLLLGRKGEIVNLDADILDGIHEFNYTKEGGRFIAMVTQIFNALAKTNIDPNVDSINKLYEARQMERVTITMATRQKERTGFEVADLPRPERVTAENDPQDDEEEGDVDEDGQPTDRIAAPEGDEEDGFDVNDDPDDEHWDDDGNNLAGGNDHDMD